MIQCLELLRTARVPPHIVAHSTEVARCAVALARHLNADSHRLNEALLWAGGLLHDIAKEISLKTGENHARLGATLLERWGFHAVAPIVRDHIELHPSMLQEPFTESLVVNYADKRVKHHEIVTLDVRFADLVARYGTTPEKKAFLERRWAMYRILERNLFAHTPIGPERLADEARRVPWPPAGTDDAATA